MTLDKGGRALGSVALITNVVYNVCGRASGLVLTLLTTPYVVRTLGDDRYGLFALAGILGSYFAFLDVGVTGAAEKFIAEKRGNSSAEEVRAIVRASWWFYIVVAVVGSGAIMALTPWLAATVLKSPGIDPATTRFVLYCAAVSFGVSMLEMVPSSILRGLQRFDWSNLLAVVFGALRVVGVVTVLVLGGDIREVMLVQIAAQVPSVVVGMRVVAHLVPLGGQRVAVWPALKRMMVFGLWSSVSRAVNPFLMHVEKLMISSLVAVSSLTYYSVPFGALAATWFIPQALVGVLFPTVSALQGSRQPERVRDLHRRGTKHLVLYFAPVAVLSVLLAPEILTLWIDAEFAEKSAAVLRILACAMLVNVSAWNSATVLMAINRPDLPAKAHLAETILYVPGAYLLVRSFGIEGAAWAWGARVTLDAAILFVLSSRALHVPLASILKAAANRATVLALGIGIAMGMAKPFLPGGALVKGAVMAVGYLTVYAGVAWRVGFDEADRSAFRGWLSTWLAPRRSRPGG